MKDPLNRYSNGIVRTRVRRSGRKLPAFEACAMVRYFGALASTLSRVVVVFLLLPQCAVAVLGTMSRPRQSVSVRTYRWKPLCIESPDATSARPRCSRANKCSAFAALPRHSAVTGA